MTQEKPSEDAKAKTERAAKEGKIKGRHINIAHRSNVEISANIGGEKASQHASAVQSAPIHQLSGGADADKQDD